MQHYNIFQMRYTNSSWIGEAVLDEHKNVIQWHCLYVIRQEVVINIETITTVIECPIYENCYYKGWDVMYATNGTIKRTLYGIKFKREYIDKEIIYREFCAYPKVIQHVCSKAFLHTNNTRDHVTELDNLFTILWLDYHSTCHIWSSSIPSSQSET